ncbi:MAG TPA: hypothetical protein ENJ75_02910 [Candidatus Kaiserbacteria bacterium]|nr:hypothetical protein [Candidatus Kaiserbacteria bacterium]
MKKIFILFFCAVVVVAFVTATTHQAQIICLSGGFLGILIGNRYAVVLKRLRRREKLRLKLFYYTAFWSLTGFLLISKALSAMAHP